MKAMFGETHQANYLINAKGGNSESRSRRELFNDRTNSMKATSPVTQFQDNMRNEYGKITGGISGGAPHSPVKSYNYGMS